MRSRSTTGWPKRTECSATSSFSTTGTGPGRSASTGARIELGPSASYVRGQYAQFLAAMGRPQEARMQAEDAARLNPLAAEDAVALVLILDYGRQYDEALKAADHAAMLDPESPGVLFLRGRILEAQGKLDEAAAVTDDAIKESDTVALGWKVQAIRLAGVDGTSRRGGRRLRSPAR